MITIKTANGKEYDCDEKQLVLTPSYSTFGKTSVNSLMIGNYVAIDPNEDELLGVADDTPKTVLLYRVVGIMLTV